MSQSTECSRAQRVFELAFPPGREQRSQAYRDGVLDMLRKQLDGASNLFFPYQLGSAEADAYLYGMDEGRRRANELTGVVDTRYRGGFHGA